jgi:dynein light intermediate chain
MSEQPRESLIQYQESIPLNPTDASKINNTIAANKKAGPPTFESKLSTVDNLNAILPPRIWTHDGKHYVQYVSHNPASRDDVANLQKLLDERLLARQAR